MSRVGSEREGARGERRRRAAKITGGEGEAETEKRTMPDYARVGKIND